MSLQQAAEGKPDHRKPIIIALSDQACGRFGVPPNAVDGLVGAHAVG